MSAILPLQNPPRILGGFETVVAPLLGRDGNVLPESGWHGGVIGQTLPGEGAQFFSSQMVGGSWGDPDADDVKPDSEMGEEVTFKPASIGVNFSCEMNAENTARGDIAKKLVQQEMARRLWSEIGLHIQAVGTSIDCPDQAGTNPTLIDVAQLPSGYNDLAAGSIEGVIHGLLDGVCDAMHTDPVFLVPRAFMPHFSRRGLVHWDPAAQAFRLLGIYPIAFDCFLNEGPGGTTTAADGSEVWIYAMLHPQVDAAAEGPNDLIGVRTIEQNVYRVRGERQFGYWFDTDHVYAAKAGVA